jgi:hypothetical protein
MGWMMPAEPARSAFSHSAKPVTFNPGIRGFIKAHRFDTGPSLVMTRGEHAGFECFGVFWVRRLVFNARSVRPNIFLINRTESDVRDIAERVYDAFLSFGPPAEAMIDFQRERVYAWEKESIFPGFPSLTWIGCQRFLKRVWQSVGKGDPPRLTNTRRYLDPVSLGGEIHLPRWDRNCWCKPIILHEISHEVTPGWHSPAFAATYIDLCVEHLGLQRSRLLESADRHGVLCDGDI